MKLQSCWKILLFPRGYRKLSLNFPLDDKVVDPTLSFKSEEQVVHPTHPLKSEVKVSESISSPHDTALS